MKINKAKLALCSLVVALGASAYSQDKDHDSHDPEEQQKKAMCAQGDASCQMQSMPGGAMMQGGGMGMMRGIMHNDKVEMNVANIDDGVIIKWTSKDKALVKSLQEMALRMKKMHLGQMPMGNGMMQGHMMNQMGKTGK